jgi:hypothetical protein
MSCSSDVLLIVQPALVALFAIFWAGLGAWMLHTAIHFHLHALRVKGTIVGFHESLLGEFGTNTAAICRYALPSGESFDVTSGLLSGGRQQGIGSQLELLVFAHRPRFVLESGDRAFGFCGGLILLMGLVLPYWYFVVRAGEVCYTRL